MKHRTGHLFRRGSNFYVRWTVEGKVFSKALRDSSGNAVTTKREAEEARSRLMAPFTVADEAAVLESMVGKLEGRKAELAKWEQQQNPPLPVAQAWTEFIASPNRPDSGSKTLYQYECQWNAFVSWKNEKHPELLSVRGVTRQIAEEYAGHLNHGRRSPNTYNKHLNLLTLVFRVIKHKAKIVENPWEDIQRKRLVVHSRRELTVDELRKVCQAATGELKILLALGVYCGLRLGDCATLRWGETDLRRGIIIRIPNKTGRRNPKPVMVPIHPTLREILEETPAESRGEYVLPETCALYLKRIDLVTDRIQRHFKACGINPYKKDNSDKPEDGEDKKRAVLEVGFHSLRHTFVSLCRESNAPLAVVESIVGHSNPSMTRHYTHIGELAATRAVAALPCLIGDAKSKSGTPAAEETLSKARAIIKTINASNWKAKKTKLLDLLKSVGAE
jgi:integrase